MYSLLLHHINQYTGKLFWLRFFNALALIASTLLIAIGCQSWFGKRTALCAAFAFATSFLVISRGQWVRPYALFTIFILLSYVSFWKMLKTTNLIWMTINLASTILALHTQYSAFIIVINQLLFGCIYALILLRNKFKTLIRVVLGTGIIIICSFPWYYHLFKNFSGFFYSNGVQPPKEFNFAIFVYHVVVKVFPRENPEVVRFHTVFVLLILAAGVILSLRKKKFFSVFFALSWIASSAGFLWICLELDKITMNQRYYMLFVPALYLLIFQGISEISDLVSRKFKSKYKEAVNTLIFFLIAIYIFLPPLQQLLNYYTIP